MYGRSNRQRYRSWIAVNSNSYYGNVFLLQIEDGHASTRDKLTRMVNCSAQMDADIGKWEHLHILLYLHLYYISMLSSLACDKNNVCGNC